MAGMNEVNALLGRGSEFEGKRSFEGTVRIDGRFIGEIHSEDTLIVGENALVTAEIRVKNVIVYGEVIGNIYSGTCVELHAPARVKGNIATPNLQADKGVMFDGNVKMHVEEPEPPAQVAAPSVTTETAAPAPAAPAAQVQNVPVAQSTEAN
jgi:cytoskeletal protein CcmA (bactofilin family)